MGFIRTNHYISIYDAMRALEITEAQALAQIKKGKIKAGGTKPEVKEGEKLYFHRQTHEWVICEATPGQVTKAKRAKKRATSKRKSKTRTKKTTRSS